MNTVTTALRTDGRPGSVQFPKPGERDDAAPPPSRATRLIRGSSSDPKWARPAFFGLLVLTACLYFYNLSASGWANAFYSAAVQAGSQNWEAFFFGSSDAANAITVDKPPASLWFMELSVRAFGLNSFAILMPQVLMALATVSLLYSTVKRYFGALAGLLAGLVFALTPVAVLMFRFNNPDALLALLMTAGAWATMRAIEKGSIRWMALVGAFIGFGFLTKTLQAFLVVPFFGLAFLILANTTWRRRVIGSIVAIAALIVSAGWWVAIVELTPKSMRPYVGGSQDDDFLSLTFGYNGFGRLSGNETGSVGGGGGHATGSGMWGSTGLTRLFNSEIGGQISWLIPSALILLVVGLVIRGRRPRTDLRRAAYVVWGGWLITTMLTFSFMAGIFHAYYTVALAPAIAAVVGMGAAEAYEHRHDSLGTITMAAAGAAASTWGFILLSRTTAYGDWLRISVLALGMGCSLLILASRWMHKKALPLLLVGAIGAGLAGPTAYSLSTVAKGHTGSIVDAGPSSGMGGGPGGHAGRGGMRAGAGTALPRGASHNGAMTRNGGASQRMAPGGAAAGAMAGPGMSQSDGGSAGGMGGLLDASTPNAQVVSTLSSNASKYTWVAAAIGSQNAAGLQLGTQHPVMAIGGFNGTDPSPTLAQFQAYVKAEKIHYLLASSGMGGSTSGTGSQILSWAKAHYKSVTIGGETFYDLTATR